MMQLVCAMLMYRRQKKLFTQMKPTQTGYSLYKNKQKKQKTQLINVDTTVFGLNNHTTRNETKAFGVMSFLCVTMAETYLKTGSILTA